MVSQAIVRRADNALWVALVGNVILQKGSLEACEAAAAAYASGRG